MGYDHRLCLNSSPASFQPPPRFATETRRHDDTEPPTSSSGAARRSSPSAPESARRTADTVNSGDNSYKQAGGRALLTLQRKATSLSSGLNGSLTVGVI